MGTPGRNRPGDACTAARRPSHARWPVRLTALAAFAAVSLGTGFVLRPSPADSSACDTAAPRLAAAIESFLRDNSGGIEFGSAEVTICDSVPGVGVGLAARERDPDVVALSTALQGVGCSRGASLGVGYESRYCTLPTGEVLTVDVLNRQGAVRVYGSSTLNGQGPLPARGTQ